MSTGKIVFLSIMGVLAIWVLIAAIWGLGVATAGIYGRGEARKQIQSAEFHITAYQQFYNQYASIKSLEGQIDELSNQLELLEPGTKAYNHTLTSLTGTKGLRHQAIQQYNADARKSYTEGQFRAEDLPYEIPDTEYPRR